MKRRDGGEMVLGLVVGVGLFALVWRLLRPRPAAAPSAPAEPETAPEVETPAEPRADIPAPAPEISGRVARNPFREPHPENDGSFPADSPDMPPEPDAEPVETDAGSGDNGDGDDEDEDPGIS